MDDLDMVPLEAIAENFRSLAKRWTTTARDLPEDSVFANALLSCGAEVEQVIREWETSLDEEGGDPCGGRTT
jgi:hypothetical protein